MSRSLILIALILPLAAPAFAHHGPTPQAMVTSFDEVQELRFCRPGERPTRPGQCLMRGRTGLLR